MKIATLAMGCFWCTEAVYQQLKGITKITSGYAGGTVPDPTYEQVSSGQTGHAEAAQIEFNPNEISFEEILFIFWRIHDPTSLNRQGNDAGTQYRSVIFYQDDAQKEIAEKTKQEAQKLYKDPIVTEIVPFTTFYPAEDYHQNYYKNNRSAPYCRFVIDPKIDKLKKIIQKIIQ